MRSRRVLPRQVFVRLRRTSLAVAAAVVGAALTAAVAQYAPTQAAASAQPAGSYPHASRATTTGTTVVDPAANVPPTPDYWPTCNQAGAGSQTCIDAVVTA